MTALTRIDAEEVRDVARQMARPGHLSLVASGAKCERAVRDVVAGEAGASDWGSPLGSVAIG